MTSSGARWGVLLVNLGTPDAPRRGPVGRYLREFLMDPRVLDVPWLPRWLLVHLAIVPRRAGVSAAAYRKVWTERGSPLLVHAQDLRDRLRERLDGVPVEVAMRYQSPPISAGLAALETAGVDRLLVFPLFPQYSSAATGSAVEAVLREAGARWNLPAIAVVPPFYDHPAFIAALATVTRRALGAFVPDKLLFSFHGLPERHCRKSDSSGMYCMHTHTCCDHIEAANTYCYRAHCFATARALAAALDLADDEWEVAFQSRLGRDPWIRPYTDVRIAALPGENIHRVAVVCPSFVADCLETLEEIGIRGAEDFKRAGGEELRLAPGLDSEPEWVDAVASIVRLYTGPRSDIDPA